MEAQFVRKVAILSVICLTLAASLLGIPAAGKARAAAELNVCATCTYTTIQSAIDAAQAGDIVNVYPGDYSETAANRTIYSGGTYTFGLYIPANKAGLTVRGVDADGVPVTDYHNIAAHVTTNATNNFGYSGWFIEADHVTVAGLDLLNNLPSDNKTMEVLGDAFTLQASHLNVAGGGSIYLNDELYDSASETSHIQSYLIEGNWIDLGGSIDLTNGAGFSGPVSGRIIHNNTFTQDPTAYWPQISFNGSGTGVPWFVHAAGGAVITGNTFSGGSDYYIRARGTYDNTQFDWAAYWEQNTYDKAVIFGANPPATVGTFSYTSGSYTFNNVRDISASIQSQVDRASAGDTVLVKAGTYVEQVKVSKSLKLLGAGIDQSIIQAPSTLPIASNQDSVIVQIAGAGTDAEFSGFTVAGPGPTGCGSIAAGIVVRDTAHANIHHNRITDVRDNPFSGCQNGVGILVGRAAWTTTGVATIANNQVDAFQKTGIVVDNAGSSAVVQDNTVTGAGPTTVTAQNGIQVSRGATATVQGNQVSGISYSGANWSASSILNYSAGTTTVQGNTVSGGQVGVYWIDSSGSIDGNTIAATQATSGVSQYWGIVVSDPSSARPSPLDDAAAPAPALGVLATPLMTVSVTNNVLTGGADSADSVGLEADSAYGTKDVALTATNNYIRNYGTGVSLTKYTGADATAAVFTKIDLNENFLAGNTKGVDNTSGFLANVTRNWWASNLGPTVASNPGGDGQSLAGAASYNPFLCDGTDAQPDTIGFQPVAGQMCTAAGATHLVFTRQPTSAYTNMAFDPQPVVQAQDANGNLAVNFSSLVQLTIGNNPTGGVLIGTSNGFAVHGVVTFSGLNINKAGAGFTLVASTSVLDAAVSNPFNVVDPTADLAVAMAVDLPKAYGGELLTYTVTVTNLGPVAAPDVEISDVLPSGVEFDSAGGDGWTCNLVSGTLKCTRSSLAPGVAPTLTIKLKAPGKAGLLTNSVQASSALPDPVPGNNQASADTFIGVNVFVPFVHIEG